MESTIVFDCEFLVTENAQRRFWCGPYDPDPVIAQIGAVKLGLEQDFPVLGKMKTHVIPMDRHGNVYELDPFFTELTGITEEVISMEGVTLENALGELDKFSGSSKLWSWGKDELNMIAISCYVSNIKPVIPATRFGNACNVLLQVGMPYEDIKKTRSNHLAGYYGLKQETLRAHDALDDALSVSIVLQHLLKNGSLDPKHLMAH